MLKHALFLVLVACSPYDVSTTTTPPIAAFGPTWSDVATICVIRPSLGAAAVTLVIHDNQQLVGATRGPSYFCYVAQPGDHEIVSDTFDSTDTAGTTTLRASPSQRYWLHQDLDNHFGSIKSKLQWIDEARAHQLIADCDYTVVSATPAHERADPLPFATSR